MQFLLGTIKAPVFWVYLFLFALLVPALAVPWALLTANRENHLSATDRWGVGKLRVEMYLLGAQSYYDGPQALAGNMLHLDAWHGYQEVVHMPRVNPRELRFRLCLGKDAYLVLLFGRNRPFIHNGEAYHAARISLNPDKPSCWLDISPEGEFLHREPLSVPGLQPSQWQEFRLLFGEDHLSLMAGGKEAGRRALAARGPQFVGFRGGAWPCAVDDVVIMQTDGLPTIRENFSNRRDFPGNLPRIAGWAALVLVGLIVLFAVLLRKPRTAAAAALSAAVTVTLCSWIYWQFHQQVLLPGYPVVARQARQNEAQKLADNTDYARQAIEKEHSRHLNPGEERIVFLGTSQTWGSGATVRAESFVCRLESMLNRSRPPERRLLALNGAVSGSKSSLLAEEYRNYYSGFEHALLVVNLRLNDTDPDVMRESLRDIANTARGNGVKPIFCIEALSVENISAGPDMGTVVEETAREMGMPVFNLHEAVRSIQDDGLFWWDIVHPTSYGHRRIAEVLLPFLQPLLDGD